MHHFVIQFLGICLFIVNTADRITNARQVFIPDASVQQSFGGQQIEAHTAYVALDEDILDAAASTWKPDGEFSADGSKYKFFKLAGGLKLTTNASEPKLDTSGQDGRVPHLTDWCPGYAPNPAKLKSGMAATVDITVGTLGTAGDIRNDTAAITQWGLDVSGNLVITATDKKGKTKTISVKTAIDPSNDPNIYIGNQPPDAMRRIATASVTNHFLLYYLLSSTTCDAAVYPHHGMDQPPATAGNPNRTAADHGRDPDKGLHADCSNSQYP